MVELEHNIGPAIPIVPSAERTQSNVYLQAQIENMDLGFYFFSFFFSFFILLCFLCIFFFVCCFYSSYNCFGDKDCLSLVCYVLINSRYLECKVDFTRNRNQKIIHCFCAFSHIVFCVCLLCFVACLLSFPRYTNVHNISRKDLTSIRMVFCVYLFAFYLKDTLVCWKNTKK